MYTTEIPGTPLNDFIPIDKGVTLKHPVSSNSDIRGCLLFGEIRRAVPGKQRSDFLVSTKSGEKSIVINGNKNLASASIKVRVGDRVDVPGAGISDAKVEAVTSRAIFTDQEATRNLTETGILVKSPVLSNFTFVPKVDLFQISIIESGAKTASSLKIGSSGLLAVNGRKIVFNEYRSLKTSRIPVPIKKQILVFNRNGTPYEVELTSDVLVNSTTLNITPLQESLPQGCTAIIGGSTAILREHCQRKDREIKVRPLKIPIARNTVLNFGYKNESGWQSGGSVVVSESVLENSLTIPIFPYAGINPIPTDSLAYFGNLPITSFYLVLDSSETEDLETGEDYGCDVMARGTDGATKKIIQIKKIKLLDTWTDF